MEKWVEKHCKTSKMAKLLHDQLNEDMRRKRQGLKRILGNYNAKEERNTDSQLCDVSNMKWCTVSQKNTVAVRNSVNTDEKQLEEKVANSSKPEDVRRYRCPTEAGNGEASHERNIESFQRSSKIQAPGSKTLRKEGKWTEMKLPVNNLRTNGHMRQHYPGLYCHDMVLLTASNSGDQVKR